MFVRKKHSPPYSETRPADSNSANLECASLARCLQTDKKGIVQKIKESGRRKGTYFLRFQALRGALKGTLSNNGGASTCSDVCVTPLTDLNRDSLHFENVKTCKFLEPGGQLT
uniref:Uncharacterized protein n=1 Tax=Glossina pallidipes TaxID=7398 RepID=A0A1A9ZSL6_GLOPL